MNITWNIYQGTKNLSSNTIPWTQISSNSDWFYGKYIEIILKNLSTTSD
jgi:hypothetical protein